jgi:hypothetical protein
MTRGDSALPHRFAVVLASGTLAGVGGGGGLDESTEDLSILVLIRLNKLGLGFPHAGNVAWVHLPGWRLQRATTWIGRGRLRHLRWLPRLRCGYIMKSTNSLDLDFLSSGSGQVRLLHLPRLLRCWRWTSPAMNLGGMSTDLLCNRVGSYLPPILVVSFPFWVCCRPAFGDYWFF